MTGVLFNIRVGPRSLDRPVNNPRSFTVNYLDDVGLPRFSNPITLQDSTDPALPVVILLHGTAGTLDVPSPASGIPELAALAPEPEDTVGDLLVSDARAQLAGAVDHRTNRSIMPRPSGTSHCRVRLSTSSERRSELCWDPT